MMIRSCDLIEVSELIHLHKGFVPIVHYGLSERIIAKISQNRTKNYCMVSIGFLHYPSFPSGAYRWWLEGGPKRKKKKRRRQP
jgi:hypothetical protein